MFARCVDRHDELVCNEDVLSITAADCPRFLFVANFHHYRTTRRARRCRVGQLNGKQTRLGNRELPFDPLIRRTPICHDGIRAY